MEMSKLIACLLYLSLPAFLLPEVGDEWHDICPSKSSFCKKCRTGVDRPIAACLPWGDKTWGLL